MIKSRLSDRALTVQNIEDSVLQRISTGSPFEASMGYSRAIVKGNWCFISGITGYDYAAMSIPESAAQQAENCFNTIFRVLDEAGFKASDIVRVQYTIINADLIDEITPVLGQIMGEVRPAATMVIAGLIRPEMKIEIEVTAMREQR